MSTAAIDRVVLYGFYGAGNLGDDLLLEAAARGIGRIFPRARLAARSHGLDQNAPPGVDLVDVERHASAPGVPRAVRLVRYLAAWARLLSRAQWLVFGGGTLFHARGGLASLATQLMICALARARGARVAALGVGVAELRRPGARFLLRRIVATCDLFLVRDRAALGECAGTAARLAGDLVFGLDELARPGDAAGARVVGLAVYPAALRAHSAHAAIADAVHMLTEAGWRVVFLGFCRAGDDDARAFAEIAARLPGPPPETRLLESDLPALLAATADLGIICGMRYHGLVLAALRGLPFVGLVHDNKIAAICETFGMPALAAEGLDPSALVAALRDAASRRIDPAKLQAEVAAARVNFSALAETAGVPC
jgi:polysaccharide pyruvyl transferase WcaK-like protein